MHNPYVLSFFLGIVEGVTEFLPVSSTAHLRITEKLFDLQLDSPYWKMYSIVIQLGAILVLPIYFRTRISKLMRSFPLGERGDRNFLTHPLSLTIVAFVVTAVPALLLTKIIGKNLESLYVIGSSLLLGGVIMWVIDTFTPRANTTHMEEMSIIQAVWIGACQILSAVFPGTSRSMSTIAGGQLAGMNRSSALEFSFFLSMPTMVVATGYDFLKTVILHKGENHTTLPPVHLNGEDWAVLAIGIVVSFLVAYVVVAWFMSWVRRRGFAPFAIYRIIVGLLVLLWARGLIGHA